MSCPHSLRPFVMQNFTQLVSRLFMETTLDFTLLHTLFLSCTCRQNLCNFNFVQLFVSGNTKIQRYSSAASKYIIYDTKRSDFTPVFKILRPARKLLACSQPEILRGGGGGGNYIVIPPSKFQAASRLENYLIIEMSVVARAAI